MHKHPSCQSYCFQILKMLDRKEPHMKLATIKPNDLAIVKNDRLIPVGETLSRDGALPKEPTMVDLIAAYDAIKRQLENIASGDTGTALDAKLLKPPVENPSKIWAAAGNYKRGSAGMGDARGRGTAGKTSPDELLENIFLKPPSAIAGPEDKILIPKNADSIFPELELCVVIGKNARHLSKNPSGTRNVRKGFESFAPIGPWITTKDEISDPHNLWMKLWINGELKQSAKTDAMINDIATQVSFLSQVTTLYPGDLITTGNPDSPEFQEKLKPGDALKAEIEGIGAMNLGVAKES